MSTWTPPGSGTRTEVAPVPGGRHHEVTAQGHTDEQADRVPDGQAARQAGRSASNSINCHSFRATGITNYLSNGGSLEDARAIAAHESSQTTRLYDRTGDSITLDEIERITVLRSVARPASSHGAADLRDYSTAASWSAWLWYKAHPAIMDRRTSEPETVHPVDGASGCGRGMPLKVSL